MFLTELYKYRTRRNEQQEDYLSTCMAELMRRDQVACRVILEVLGLKPPSRLVDRSIHTQYRYPGCKDRPDVVIQVGRGLDVWRAAIEAKVKAAPDRSQVRRYEQLEPHVALLAPEAKLGLGADWEGVPRGSWEAMWLRLAEENVRLDPGSIPRFRQDFLDLLRGFGLAGLVRPTPDDVRAAVRAHGRFVGWHELLREGVRGLLANHEIVFRDSDDQRDGVREAVWESNSGLDVYWESERAPAKGLPLEGLGLSADVGHGAGAPILEWKVWVYPTGKARKAHKNLVGSNGAWQDEGGWWSLHIADSGDPEAPFQDQVRRVVVAARGWLREDLGIDVPATDLELPGGLGLTPLPTVLHALTGYDEVDRALSAWASELLRRVFDALRDRLGEARVRMTRRGRRKIVVTGPGGPGLHLGTWHSLGDEALVGFFVWFGGKRRNRAMTRPLLTLSWPEGISARPHEKWLNWNLLLDPTVCDVADAVPGMATGIADALAGMDGTLFPGAE